MNINYKFTCLLVRRALQTKEGDEEAKRQLIAIQPYLLKLKKLWSLVDSVLHGYMTPGHIRSVYDFEDGVRWMAKGTKCNEN